MPVEDVKRLGRSTQGVIVMRLRGDETVSAVAPVVESDEQDAVELIDLTAPPSLDGGAGADTWVDGDGSPELPADE
jgi:DNA gyrase/topoisomerase IV subunit A-like protein